MFGGVPRPRPNPPGPPPPGPPGPPRPPRGPPPPGWAIDSCSENAEVINTLSPQTTGDDQPRPGILAFHRTFLSAAHSAGSCVSVDTPLAFGPRNCGQSALRAAGGSTARQRPNAAV